MGEYWGGDMCCEQSALLVVRLAIRIKIPPADLGLTPQIFAFSVVVVAPHSGCEIISSDVGWRG